MEQTTQPQDATQPKVRRKAPKRDLFAAAVPSSMAPPAPPVAPPTAPPVNPPAVPPGAPALPDPAAPSATVDVQAEVRRQEVQPTTVERPGNPAALQDPVVLAPVIASPAAPVAPPAPPIVPPAPRVEPPVTEQVVVRSRPEPSPTTPPPPTGLAHPIPPELTAEEPASAPSAGAPSGGSIDRTKLAKAAGQVRRATDFNGKFQRVDYPLSMRQRLAVMEALLSGAAAEEGRVLCTRDILLTALDRLFAQCEKAFGRPLPQDKIEAVQCRLGLSGSAVLGKLRDLVAEVPTERDIDALGVKIPRDYLTRMQVITTLLDDKVTQRAIIIQATVDFLKHLDGVLGRKA